MNYNEISKYIVSYHKVYISFDATYDQIKEIDDKIFELEKEYDVDVEFFNGNGACFPYINCEGESKNNCIVFIILISEFLENMGITVSL